MKQLLEIMARLRDPHEGCPWDRDQTFATIAPHTIEEAYEVADSIERGDMGELRDELGDLLFQVVFYAQMAREEGLFDFHDVERAICEKMLRRHPHVFGDDVVTSVEEQSRAWARHKTEERQKKEASAIPGQLDGVASALPALIRAGKLQKRAAEVGFDWPDIEPVFDKVHEEIDEVRVELEQGVSHQLLEKEIGDLLFACVNLARHAKVDAETALRSANSKFERRFRSVESALSGQGRSLSEATLWEMDELWNRVKAEEKGENYAGSDPSRNRGS
jgi:MazG family protein